MQDELVERVAKIAHDTFENDDDSGGGAYLRLARAIIPIVADWQRERDAGIAEGFSRFRDKPDHADAPKLIATAIRGPNNGRQGSDSAGDCRGNSDPMA